jgi:DNA-binding NtrC family response regulator
MCSLLLVEDDADLRGVLEDLLVLQGHDVRTAQSGVDALKALDFRVPQLVISDLEMPDLDGLQLIHRMFVDDLGRENVPVILMSASPRLDQIAEVAGIPYVLAKPFSVDKLASVVDRALTEARPPAPIAPLPTLH